MFGISGHGSGVSHVTCLGSVGMAVGSVSHVTCLGSVGMAVGSVM